MFLHLRHLSLIYISLHLLHKTSRTYHGKLIINWWIVALARWNYPVGFTTTQAAVFLLSFTFHLILANVNVIFRYFCHRSYEICYRWTVVDGVVPFRNVFSVSRGYGECVSFPYSVCKLTNIADESDSSRSRNCSKVEFSYEKSPIFDPFNRLF